MFDNGEYSMGNVKKHHVAATVLLRLASLLSSAREALSRLNQLGWLALL